MKFTINLLRTRLRPIYGSRETEAMIRLIFETLKGWRPVDIVLHADDTLSPYMRGKILAILDRLEKHEPLQYILGRARFYGLTLHVTSDVLIPRPETEELVDLICKDAGERADLHLLDACTGSGCIAIALARNLRFPHITAFDISGAALEVARGNAGELNVKIDFLQADALSIKKGDLPGEPWDIIVANPPYIGTMEKSGMERNVLDYEPHSALFVPQNEPLLFYLPLARYGLATLRPGGRIYFEINPLHAEALAAAMTQMGYDNLRIELDISGKRRFIIAANPEE